MNDTTKPRMKPILIACFTLFVLLSVTAQACVAATVSIADVTMEPDSTITLPISIDGIASYGTGTINIVYDSTVVHVTKVASSPDSTVTAKNVNNTAGIARISAWNLDGVSGDIVFADVTFDAVGVGLTPLDLDVITLQDTSYTEITPLTINDGSIEIEAPQPPQPPAPFLISGYTYYENGTPCNNSIVNVTNLNNGMKWIAETSGASNYYQITLTSGIDLNATDVLRFEATDGTNSNLTHHTMTNSDVDTGGLFDFNLTLGLVDPAPSLSTYTISNTTISPNGDGIEDDTEIGVEFSEPVDAAIRIEDATGVIKTLYTGLGVTDPDPQIWGGTDDDGNIVAGGTYQVNVTMDDGVNLMVYDNTRSIVVAEEVTTSVSIADVMADSGDTVITHILINGIIDYGTATINLAYNSAVVHVDDVTSSSDSTVTAKNIDNTAGLARISAWNLGGVSGDIVFANVEFTVVGSNGDSTPLTLTVDTLQDISYNEIPVAVSSGSFTVQPSTDPAPSLVTYTISNTTISPNGDGIMDDTEIDVEFSEPVDTVIRIENATGIIKTLYTGSTIADPDPQVWDGTDDSDNIVADGTYQVNVTMDDGVNPVVYNNTRSIVVTTPVVDPSPSLVTYTISNTTISPNGDGITDDTEIDVEFSEPVDTVIRIENETGIIKTLYTGSTIADPDPQTWDGTDDGSNIVADGTYQVNVTMNDGVNQVVYDNARTIRVRTGPEVDVAIGCGIIYPYPYPGCSVTLPIVLRGIIDYGASTINLYYDASIVEVDDVTGSEDSSVESWNVVTPGWLKMSAFNTTGVSGDVVFANVVFNSVGNIGECSDLNLTVDTLGDIYYEELPYITTNCSICIEDPYAPVVSKPSANPDSILNDNGRARAPGTNVSVLSVFVTDENGVASVTINLSPILGPGNDSVPMTNVMGTDKWTVEVNAPYDAGVGQVHDLAVNATDLFGNSNTAKTIELTVLRRGDVVRDNKVNMFDYLYIARYTVGLEPAPDELVTGTIPADSHNGINMLDALYIARHTVNLESAP